MILAASGHRPDKLGGYSSAIATRLQHVAEHGLAELKPQHVIIGMALGWDQVVGWAAHARKIPFYAYLPFCGQEETWPVWSQDRYRELLSYAAGIKVCSPGAYSPGKMQIRNERMVDAADAMFTLYNGSPGGTRNCLEYATKKNKLVYNCWDNWAHS